ncbi:Myb domain [Hexamita inflata]|uniref:Myb domain n=1 Tax=Hexamita inflata TaxID=28002 RepID=A0AA86R9L6_9EUKA|nr:Myb domain [Hexamita inflata]CAI9972097.1 Myb domain [Hexamita inflata]
MLTKTFGELIQENKSKLRIFSQNYRKSRSKEMEERNTQYEKELHDIAHEDPTETNNDLMGIFVDDTLQEYDSQHAVDKNRYKAFNTTRGINYSSRGKTQKIREDKLKTLKQQNRTGAAHAELRISNVWTQSENKTFFEVATALGCDCKLIAQFLPHKTEQQIKTHINHCRRTKFAELMQYQNGNINVNEIVKNVEQNREREKKRITMHDIDFSGFEIQKQDDNDEVLQALGNLI